MKIVGVVIDKNFYLNSILKNYIVFFNYNIFIFNINCLYYVYLLFFINTSIYRR